MNGAKGKRVFRRVFRIDGISRRRNGAAGDKSGGSTG
jgi:hypothetical protein